MSSLTTYIAKPPAKRVNYLALRQPTLMHPAGLFDGCYDYFILRPHSRGLPIDCSIIYLPEQADLDHKTKQAQNWWDTAPQSALKERPKRNTCAGSLNIEIA